MRRKSSQVIRDGGSGSGGGRLLAKTGRGKEEARTGVVSRRGGVR